MKKIYQTPACDVVMLHGEITALGISGKGGDYGEGPSIEYGGSNVDGDGEVIEGPEVRELDWGEIEW